VNWIFTGKCLFQYRENVGVVVLWKTFGAVGLTNSGNEIVQNAKKKLQQIMLQTDWK